MITGWIFLIASIPMFLVLGAVLGFLLADGTYRRGLTSLGYFATRVACKAFLRTINSRNVRMLEKVDIEHSVLSAYEKLKCVDPSALKVAGQFKDNLKKIYDEELVAVYFFGSRMRGNHKFWSDLDVAIFFRPTVSLSRARYQVRWEVFQILLQHGLLIQPRLASDQALYSVSAEVHPAIRRAVQTGIAI